MGIWMNLWLIIETLAFLMNLRNKFYHLKIIIHFKNIYGQRALSIARRVDFVNKAVLGYPGTFVDWMRKIFRHQSTRPRNFDCQAQFLMYPSTETLVKKLFYYIGII